MRIALHSQELGWCGYTPARDSKLTRRTKQYQSSLTVPGVLGLRPKEKSQNTELGTQPPWPGLSQFVKGDFTHQ